jgi:hypothetical protein
VEAAQSWRQLAEFAERGGENCLHGLERKDGELLGRGFGDLVSAAREEARLVNRLEWLTGVQNNRQP